MSTQTDESGGFSILVTDPPVKSLGFRKPGYRVLNLNLDPGTIPDPLIVTMEPEQKAHEDTGGIYGKVFDSSGLPPFAFHISVLPVNPEGIIRPSRPFLSIDGDFFIKDMQEGSYNLCARRQSDPNPYVCPVPRAIEVRKGRVQGPIVLQLQEPDKEPWR